MAGSNNRRDRPEERVKFIRKNSGRVFKVWGAVCHSLPLADWLQPERALLAHRIVSLARALPRTVQADGVQYRAHRWPENARLSFAIATRQLAWLALPMIP